MHDTVLRFLVVLQTPKNLLRADIHFRQASQAQHGIGDPAGGHAVRAAHCECDIGGGNHAPSDGLSMQQRTIIRLGFKRVADRVTQVQYAS